MRVIFTFITATIGLGAISQEVTKEEALGLVENIIKDLNDKRWEEKSERTYLAEYYPPSAHEQIKKQWGTKYFLNGIKMEEYLIDTIVGSTVTVYSHHTYGSYWSRITVFEVIREEGKLYMQPSFDCTWGQPTGTKQGFMSPWLSSIRLEVDDWIKK